jgi:hypothetical protein
MRPNNPPPPLAGCGGCTHKQGGVITNNNSNNKKLEKRRMRERKTKTKKQKTAEERLCKRYLDVRVLDSRLSGNNGGAMLYPTLSHNDMCAKTPRAWFSGRGWPLRDLEFKIFYHCRGIQRFDISNDGNLQEVSADTFFGVMPLRFGAKHGGDIGIRQLFVVKNGVHPETPARPPPPAVPRVARLVVDHAHHGWCVHDCALLAYGLVNRPAQMKMQMQMQRTTAVAAAARGGEEEEATCEFHLVCAPILRSSEGEETVLVRQVYTIPASKAFLDMSNPPRVPSPSTFYLPPKPIPRRRSRSCSRSRGHDGANNILKTKNNNDTSLTEDERAVFGIISDIHKIMS